MNTKPTPRQQQVLDVFAKSGGKTVTPKEIAFHLGISRIAAHNLVHRLVKKGVIRRNTGLELIK